MNNKIDDLNEEDVIDIVKNLSIDEYEWYSDCKKYEGHNEDIALIVRIAINKLLDLYYKQKQITKNAITIIREMDLSKILSPLDDEFLEEYIYSYTMIKEMPILNPHKKIIYGDENKND